MRINMKPGRLLALSALGLALSLGVNGIAAAQETQQPKQFGPRANKQQQAQQAPGMGLPMKLSLEGFSAPPAALEKN